MSVNVHAQQNQSVLSGTQGPPSPTNNQSQGQPGASTQEEDISRAKCLMARPLFGDLEFLGSWFQNWSTGVTVSAQAIKYTFGTKKASSNTSAGAGIAFRYYGNSPIGDEQEAKRLGFTDQDLQRMDKDKRGMYTLPIYKIKPECRATTSDIGRERTKKLAGSIFSITPTVYYSKQENVDDLSIQPALLVGFLDDIISVGPGFNLTGPEKGKVFMVLSLGYGFKF
ncbi:MAG: hypothetical protein E6K63_02265 [Nitrospirae bacterium]|nr:MAG: hypothetical protein E6K63_02265 [Nitrospirota bacterium]